MTERRDYDEDDNKLYFRSDRMVCENGNWYFTTREGLMQGPFADKLEAQKALAEYIDIMKANSSGELSLAPTLSLEIPAA